MKAIKCVMPVIVGLAIACNLTSSPQVVRDNHPDTPAPAALPHSLTPVATHTNTPVATPTEQQNTAQHSPIVTPPAGSKSVTQVSPVNTPISEIPTDESTRQRDSGNANITDDAAIIFHRSGGFAGVDQQWMIYIDGRIEQPGGQQVQADEQQVKTLLEAIDAAGFFELKNSYIPLNSCCDRFTYAITVQQDDKVKTVTTIDASPDAPQELQQIIDEIGKLIINLSK